MNEGVSEELHAEKIIGIRLHPINNNLYVTRSRKRGPFPQKSDCELDLSADSVKSVVHARENRLTLARSIPKLQSFEYHTHAYLGFEISTFISVL